MEPKWDLGVGVLGPLLQKYVSGVGGVGCILLTFTLEDSAGTDMYVISVNPSKGVFPV